MIKLSDMDARRAIESLRSGVPNSIAVDVLGVDQPEITAAFNQCLESVIADHAGSNPGFFIEGEFGSGKSHILRYLEHEATKRKFVVSGVTISKETPLGDLSAVYRSAISGLRYPDGRIGGTLADLFERFDTSDPAYIAFYKRVCGRDADLDPLFQASMLLYDKYRGQPEIVEQLVEFWDGSPPQVAIWKKLLKEIGAEITIRATAVRTLAPQRFLFASLAIRAARFAGWLVTLDELELIAKFSLRTRTRAYGAISDLFLYQTPQSGDVRTSGFERTIIIGAITADLLGELLYTRNERYNLPRQYQLSPDVISAALKGLDFLAEPSTRHLIRNEVNFQQLHQCVRRLYWAAYSSEELNGDELDGFRKPTEGANMRQTIRAWIAYWDLKRFDASYTPHIVAENLAYDLSEDEDIDNPPDLDS